MKLWLAVVGKNAQTEYWLYWPADSIDFRYSQSEKGGLNFFSFNYALI